MRLTFVLFFTSICFCSRSQVVPTERFYDWTKAGLDVELPATADTIDITALGAPDDGSAAVNSFIQTAIDSLNGRFGVIYFPEGIFLINASMILPDSIVLKGAGADLTTLLFDLGGAPNDCMDITRSQSAAFTKISEGFQKNSNTLTVADASSFSAGDYAEIRQDNGAWDSNPASYAAQCVGQMVKVTAVSGNEIQIEPALRIDLDTALNAEIRKVTPVTHAGIECMKIIRQDSSASASVFNIHFNYAVNCWVKGVESAKSMGAHVLIEYSKNIAVTGCYIHHAFGYDGSGTRGYGVCLRQHASDCLIENNVFRFLRHAMMVKEGANGNVFAYNYSREPNRSEPIADFSGDISLHGHYAFANLFEGNIVQNIITDHYWGQSGPHNTFLRNRAELYGMGLLSSGSTPLTSAQNYVGNEITNNTSPYGNYLMAGTGHFEYGNNVKGVITPAGVATLDDSSYYLSSKPLFWDTAAWAAIGIPFDIASGNIPAKQRYDAMDLLTVCALVPDSIPVDTTDTTGVFISYHEKTVFVAAHPNPVSEKITVEIFSQQTSAILISITTISGKTILSASTAMQQGENMIQLDLPEGMHNGFYFLHIITPENIFSHKIIKNTLP